MSNTLHEIVRHLIFMCYTNVHYTGPAKQCSMLLLSILQIQSLVNHPKAFIWHAHTIYILKLSIVLYDLFRISFLIILKIQNILELKCGLLFIFAMYHSKYVTMCKCLWLLKNSVTLVNGEQGLYTQTS